MQATRVICTSCIFLVLFGSDRWQLAATPLPFEVSVIHLNDFHDRYEEIDQNGGACRDDRCIGGFSRLYTAIKQLKQNNPDSIVLNAGDNFQGTYWFTLYKWNVTQHFFNFLPIDVHTLGNHEFDNGVEGVLPFVRALKAPVVVANIDASKELLFQAAIKKSVVLERNGRRIGVIGVIGRSTKDISHPGNLQFLEEVESVNKEAERMVSEENVDTIIVLSHCGLKSDKWIAQNASPKIGLIVGGHTHSLLYNGETLPGPDKKYASYPLVVYQKTGKKVLIVQASAYSKYIGHITVKYDANGDVISWFGNTIYLNGSIPQDEKINEEIAIWKMGVDSITNRVIGSTSGSLNHKTCRYAECTLGNFIADAMLFDQKDVTAAILSTEGLRTSISKGNITYGDLSTAVPFRNTYDSVQLQGANLKQLLEDAAGSEQFPLRYKTNLKSVAGLRVLYNVTNPIGSRVVSLQISSKGNTYYEDVHMDAVYSLVVDSFTIDRSEGNPVLHEDIMLNPRIGSTDVDVIANFLASNSPIEPFIEHRIVVTT